MEKKAINVSDDFRQSAIEVVEKIVEKVVHEEQMMKLNKIEPNREQPRKNFDEDALVELADSIKQFGIIQPITVRKNCIGGFELISGERRLKAAKSSRKPTRTGAAVSR